MNNSKEKSNKKTMFLLVNALLAFFFFVGQYNPFQASEYYGVIFPILYILELGVLVILGWNLIKFIVAPKKDEKNEKLLIILILAALLARFLFNLCWSDWSISDFFKYEKWCILSLIVQGGLTVAYFIAANHNSYEKTETNERATNNKIYVDDKQNNVTRFLLTFFLGWIGSLIINHSNLKPKGYKSRTLAYFFLLALTFGLYALVASICNLSFDPMKEKNIGYFLDGTSIGNVKKEEENHAVAGNQLEDLAKLKSFLEQGIITQEDFDATKKRILGL